MCSGYGPEVQAGVLHGVEHAGDHHSWEPLLGLRPPAVSEGLALVGVVLISECGHALAVPGPCPRGVTPGGVCAGPRPAEASVHQFQEVLSSLGIRVPGRGHCDQGFSPRILLAPSSQNLSDHREGPRSQCQRTLEP